MTFVIMTIILGGIPGFVGALLASRYSVFALVPTALFFLVLAGGGCLLLGSSVSASALAVFFGLTCLHFGYFVRLFAPQIQRPSGRSSDLKRAQQNTPQQRVFGGQRRDVRRSAPSKVNSRFQEVAISALETSAPDDFEVKNKRPIVDVP